MTVVVIRHGETEWNLAGRLQGRLDSALTPTGLDQMTRVARRCAHLKATRLFCSSAQRARQSAELIIAANPSIELEIRPDLREYDFGELEGKTRDEVEHVYPGFWHRWLADATLEAIPRAEPIQGFFERVRGFLRELAILHNHNPALVVTHGGFIRALVCFVLELDTRHINRLSPSNGGLSTIEFRGSVPYLVSFNETAHMLVA